MGFRLHENSGDFFYGNRPPREPFPRELRSHLAILRYFSYGNRPSREIVPREPTTTGKENSPRELATTGIFVFFCPKSVYVNEPILLLSTLREMILQRVIPHTLSVVCNCCNCTCTRHQIGLGCRPFIRFLFLRVANIIIPLIVRCLMLGIYHKVKLCFFRPAGCFRDGHERQISVPLASDDGESTGDPPVASLALAPWPARRALKVETIESVSRVARPSPRGRAGVEPALR